MNRVHIIRRQAVAIDAAHSRKYHFALLLFFLSACTSNVFVEPERLQADTTKDILVLTHDGRTIRFFGGDYQVVQIGDSEYLRGKGRLFLNENRSQAQQFQGEIPFAQIKSVEVTEKSVSYYTGPILFGAAWLLIVLLMISMKGIQFGGLGR
jgi:hypothetical protein